MPENTPPFSKGAIVLTPQNSVGRVRWIHADMKVGVEYLEYSSGYNVFNANELKLLCESADPPKFDIICEEKVRYERELYDMERREINEFKSRKKKKLSLEEKIAEELLKKMSKEEVMKLLEGVK